jgi:hypothetical protein
VKKNFEFFCERGGHVISAAILDFRIFPEKSEEKNDIKIIFSTEFHGQTSHKKQPFFYLYRHLLLKKL